jgi:hypothetical protein
MLVKVNTEVKDYDGEVLRYDGGDPMTFKTVARQALNNVLQNEELSGEEKLKMFDLSVKLGNGEEVELNLDEANLIKSRAAKTVPSPLLYGAVAKVLEDASSSKEKAA